MRAKERRVELANLLMSRKEAISGGELSKIYGVSRQIIVQDITILKASGYDILSTHSGYVLQKSPHAERVLNLCHKPEETERELMTIVDLGGAIVDVFVKHKVYGKISAPLNIFSELQVRQFIDGVRSGESSELMSITGGYHYHTLRADSEEQLDRIEKELSRLGFLVKEA